MSPARVQLPPALPDEEARLAALYTYESLDGEMRPELDPLVRLTARLFSVPMAVVSLIDRDEQVFAASCGMSVGRTGRGVSFCGHALAEPDLLVVPDAAADPRFSDNPLVQGGPGIRFYAGAPLRSPLGHTIGTLCILDDRPRAPLSPGERETLLDLAALVLDKFELRRLGIASLDGQRRFQNIAATSPDAIVCTDQDGHVTFWNETAERLFGWTAAEALGGSLERIVPAPARPPLRERLDRLARGERPRLTERTVELEMLQKGGGTVPVELSLSMWREGGTASFGAIMRDITERRSHEDRLHHLAHHDTLTSLPNRAVLLERLAAAVARDEPLAVLLIDLDGFKEVNDTLGHSAGDEVLEHVAQRLSQCVREGDLVARFGGDEFALLLSRPGEAQVTAIADRIVHSLATPFTAGGRIARIGASVGIAEFPGHGVGADELIANADLAMYQAKREGRGCWRRFAVPLREQAMLRRAHEGEIRRAIDRDQFVLYYQPQIDLADGRLIGAEALLRWMHPSCGLLPPLEFFAALEDSPMAAELGDWVLQTACAQARAWMPLTPGFRIGVNLFEAQLRNDDLVERVEAVLARTGLDPAMLELELAEPSILRQNGRALRALQARGVAITCDDFGSGHGSLAMLKSCPLDRLKIDRGFIAALGTNPADGVIVNAIVALGRGLGIDVVAEGVETPEQRDLLRGASCGAAQGYLFGRPMPAAAFKNWLERHRAERRRA